MQRIASRIVCAGVLAVLLAARPSSGQPSPQPNFTSLEADLVRLERAAAEAAPHRRSMETWAREVRTAYDLANRRIALTTGDWPGRAPDLTEEGRRIDAACAPILERIKALGAEAPDLAGDVADILEGARQQVAACQGFTAAVVSLEVNRALQKTTDFYRAAARAREQMEETLKSLADAEGAIRDEVAFLAARERQAREALVRAEAAERLAEPKLAELAAGCDRYLPILRAWGEAPGLRTESQARLEALGARARATCQPIPFSPTLEPRNRTAALASAGEDLRRLAGHYSQPPCGLVRQLYPQVVQVYEAHWLDAALQLAQSADLPKQAAACRDRGAAPQTPPELGAVGAGPSPPALVEVPALVGVGSGQVEGVLGAQGLVLGAVSAAGTAERPELAFTVAAQDPPARSMVERGRAVSVSIWQGASARPPEAAATPEPVVAAGPRGGVPNVVDATLEQAVARLEAAGLRVGGVTRGGRPPRPDLAGRIYFQDPAAGSPLPADRAVAVKQYDKLAAAPPTASQPTACTGGFAGRWSEQLPSLGLNFTLGKGFNTWQGVMTIRPQGSGYAVDFGIPAVPVMTTQAQGDKLVFQGQIDSSAAEGKPPGTYVSFMQFEMAMTPRCWIDMKVRETLSGTAGGATGPQPPFDSGPWTRVP